MLPVMHGTIRLLALAIGTTVCLISIGLGAADPASSGPSAPEKSEPLCLLTYDHGGLVLWGHDHFAERLSNAVSWLDKYPSFKIGVDNEAYTYDALAEQHPDLLGKLRGWLKRYAGRFGIGTCTYGQPLSAFINEESNVRQLVYAIRADQRHFGYTPVIYLMSEHAMHSQIPQLLAGCGFQGAILRTHFMMYGYNPTFDAPIGWWVGLDGSRLPTVPTYPGEGAAFGKTTVDN
jgi:alpha-mannosidase